MEVSQINDRVSKINNLVSEITLWFWRLEFELLETKEESPKVTGLPNQQIQVSQRKLNGYELWLSLSLSLSLSL